MKRPCLGTSPATAFSMKSSDSSGAGRNQMMAQLVEAGKLTREDVRDLEKLIAEKEGRRRKDDREPR
jgi:hypothetical protein